MEQLEFKFFWPLEEQIPLDLDFTESDEFSRELFRKEIVSVLNHTGAYTIAPTTTSFHIQPSPNYAGHWEVSGENFKIFREKRPSWFIRKFNELLIGWVWVDDE
jgi:hypothetical protein